MPLPDNSGQNSPEFTKLSNGIIEDFSVAKCQTWVSNRIHRLLSECCELHGMDLVIMVKNPQAFTPEMN